MIIKEIEGSVIPVEGDNIDTDRIIPARFLRLITFDTLGKYPFYDERFGKDGKVKNHPFNDAKYKGASILLVNKNFGCGSSREHAPQALMRFGINAIIGETFGQIFETNCSILGVPAIKIEEKEMRKLMQIIKNNHKIKFNVSIQDQKLTYNGNCLSFEINESARKSFLDGTWDTLDLLLTNMDKIKMKSKSLSPI